MCVGLKMSQNTLDNMKQQFENSEKRDEFFSASSANEEFTNSQLFFYIFSQSKNYKLHNDGEFERLCTDMENYLGKELYLELIQTSLALSTSTSSF